MKDVDLLRNIALISGKGFQKGSLSEKHEITFTSLTPTTHLTVFARYDAVFADTESAVCAQSWLLRKIEGKSRGSCNLLIHLQWKFQYFIQNFNQQDQNEI